LFVKPVKGKFVSLLFCKGVVTVI